MELLIFQLLCKLLKSNATLLSIAIHQRAKFEGWLKFELAKELKKSYKDTRVEEHSNGSLVDIITNSSLLELKTPNTSYTNNNCINKVCAITDNINGIISDIQKLRSINNTCTKYHNGYIAFVLFPIDNGNKYQAHINKIRSALGAYTSYIYDGVLAIKGVPVYVFVAKVF